MTQATNGNTVQVHYCCRLVDGTELDSSASRDPLEVTIGSGSVLKGVEAALVGMRPGETKTVTISADEAYGEHREDLVQEVDRARIPPQVDLAVGARLQAQAEGGQQIDLTVVEMDEETVTLDANHPLAGKDLTFELRLVAIA